MTNSQWLFQCGCAYIHTEIVTPHVLGLTLDEGTSGSASLKRVSALISAAAAVVVGLHANTTNTAVQTLKINEENF